MLNEISLKLLVNIAVTDLYVHGEKISKICRQLMINLRKRASCNDGADSQRRSAIETAGKSSGGGEVGVAEGKERREIKSVNQQL
jgi:hypothetical protein